MEVIEPKFMCVAKAWQWRKLVTVGGSVRFPRNLAPIRPISGQADDSLAAVS